jgi:hypothetical protein
LVLLEALLYQAIDRAEIHPERGHTIDWLKPAQREVSRMTADPLREWDLTH